MTDAQSPTPIPDDPPIRVSRFLRVKQVMHITGLAKSTLYALVKRRRLSTPAAGHRPGGGLDGA
jgi:hypothetical protein